MLKIIMALLCFNAFADTRPVETVRSVDLNRYLGKWYEIASFPQRFQKGCVASTATYSLRDDGDIDVLNECRLNTLNGPLKSAHGKAWVTDKVTNAKLRVRFFWPFSGKYWIIDLSPDYSYAVVGHPDRDYLWILSRTPQMLPSVYEQILERIVQQGFDVNKLKKTPQIAPELTQ